MQAVWVAMMFHGFLAERFHCSLPLHFVFTKSALDARSDDMPYIKSARAPLKERPRGPHQQGV